MAGDTPTPRGVQAILESGEAAARRDRKRFDDAHNEGLVAGRRAARQEILDLLQEMYSYPDVERGSEKGKAILEVTKYISQHFIAHGGPTLKHAPKKHTN